MTARGIGPILLLLIAASILPLGFACSRDDAALKNRKGLNLLAKVAKKYGQAASLSAKVLWSTGPPDLLSNQETRQFAFQDPNLLYISAQVEGRVLAEIRSDGKKVQQTAGATSTIIDAPPDFRNATIEFLEHPEICGTMLLLFITCQGKVEKLTPDLTSVREVEPVILNDGTRCQVVQFDSGPKHGIVHIAVAELTGYIRRIAVPTGAAKGFRREDGLPLSIIQESIDSTEIDGPIDKSLFVIKKDDPGTQSRPDEKIKP